MARIARIVVPGLPHYVNQRGNRDMKTFFGESDYRTYIDMLAEACEETRVACWAYCLLPNRVDLILVPPKTADGADGLRACLAETHRRYTRMVNEQKGWRGHLWQERFHSCAMDEAHALACARYLEQSPLREKQVKRLRDWRWSSARAHLAGHDDALCQVSPLLGRAERRLGLDWRAYLAKKATPEERDAIERHGRSGRPLGSKAFLKRLEARTGLDLQPRPRGRPRKDAAERR